jgi:hypothetical protein
MLRAVLVGTMSFAVVSACGFRSDAPAAQPGAVAGTVLEVSGAVKVGAVALAVGSTVKTDDVIETGADGSVVIELAHNRARWELGPNNKKKPTESLAWTAAKAEGSAARTTEQTTAAGRPAERSAADSASSAPKPASAPSAQPMPPAEAAPAAAAPAATPAPPARSRAAQAPASPAPGGGGLAGAPRALPPARAAADTEPELQKSKPAGSLDSLASCLPIGMTVKLAVHVANHVPAIKFVGHVDPAVALCITTAAKQLSLSVATGDLALTLTK